MAELNNKEKRFIREWELQTRGSRKGFFILYTIIWAILFSFFQIAINYVITEFRDWLLQTIAFILFSLLMGLILTLIFYYRNQAKYLELKMKEKGFKISEEKTAS